MASIMSAMPGLHERRSSGMSITASTFLATSFLDPPSITPSLSLRSATTRTLFDGLVGLVGLVGERVGLLGRRVGLLGRRVGLLGRTGLVCERVGRVGERVGLLGERVGLLGRRVGLSGRGCGRGLCVDAPPNDAARLKSPCR